MCPHPSSAPVHALVPAAGLGRRFGGESLKQLVPLAGRPLLDWTLSRVLACSPASLTVALPPEAVDEAPRLLLRDDRVRWVAGGPTRQRSVELCLEASPGEDRDLILVHDGARPLVAVEDLLATLEAARASDAAVLVRPIGDTLKRVAAGTIRTTVERRDLVRAETPQVFRRALLREAIERARRESFTGTDEASLVERIPGVEIVAVSARRPNPKLTAPGDLQWIEALLAAQNGSPDAAGSRGGRSRSARER